MRAEAALQAARQCGLAWIEALALRHLAFATLAVRSANERRAETLWRESIDSAIRCEALPFEIQAKLELGRHLTQVGRATEAEALVEHAVVQARQLEMFGWLARSGHDVGAATRAE